MKIISIVSSGRKNGNTERIVRCIEEELSRIAIEKNIQVEYEPIYLGSLNIKFCRGCRICFDKGEDLCPLKDEILNIKDKIDKADGVVLASPVYVEDVNGIMKNWIDRMAFNCHRPAFAGKSSAIITTSGAGSTGHAIRTMKSALQAWGFYISTQGKFRTGELMEKSKMDLQYGSKIKAMANKLFNDINACKAETPSIYSLMIFKIQQKYWQKTKKQLQTIDYFYWKNKGWIEKDCNYYIKHNSSYIKVKISRVLGSIVSMLFV